MLSCRKFQTDPSWLDIFGKEDLVLKKDWFGKDTPFPLAFHLALSPTKLFFGATAGATGKCRPKTESGEFVEGLWEYDVIELFLGSEGNSYQEFNLGANGSWWTGVFSDYRKPLLEYSRPRAEIFSLVENERTVTGLSVSLDELAIKFESPSQLIAQTTAIWGYPERLYFSSAPSPNVEPDFHLRAGMNSLNFVSV